MLPYPTAWPYNYSEHTQMSHSPLETRPGRIFKAEPRKWQLSQDLAGGRSCLPWKMAQMPVSRMIPLLVSGRSGMSVQADQSSRHSSAFCWHSDGISSLGIAGITTGRKATTCKPLLLAAASLVLTCAKNTGEEKNSSH